MSGHRSTWFPDDPDDRKLSPWVVIGLLVLPFAAFFFYQAWINPRIEFLAPSFKAIWILHRPEKPFPETLSGRTSFRRRFRLHTVPSTCTLTIRAATDFDLSVNDRVVEPDSRRASRNWKTASTFEIAPLLVVQDNTILIRVRNNSGPPALLVEAAPSHLPDGRLALSSDTDWESASATDLSLWSPCVLTYQDPPVFGNDLSPIRKSAHYPFYLAVFGAYAAFIFAGVVPWRLFHRRRSKEAPKASDAGALRRPNATAVSYRYLSQHRLLAVAAFLLIAGILFINIHNLLAYPYSRSRFDSDGHIEYIKYVAAHWRVPLPTGGWQMYQPPLYYFISAAIYTVFGGAGGEPGSLKAVQALGMLSGWAIVLTAWLTIRLVAPGNPAARLAALGTAALMPMLLYISPTISNETFSAALISLAIYLFVRYGYQARISVKRAAILGTVVGLAMLAKFTAFLAFVAIVAFLLLRLVIKYGSRRREAAMLGVFAILVFCICGPFYIRNIVLYKQPFVGNWDRQSGYNVEQPPGYRTLGFYVRFGSVLTHAPERSRWLSFWDGYYGSMWTDPHFNMLDYKDDETNSIATVLLWMALLPSAAMLVGFTKAIWLMGSTGRFGPESMLVIVSVITMSALILYTLQVPSITVIKAFFSLSLLPAMAVFSAIGFAEIAANLERFRPALYVSLIVLFGLISRLFWYSGS